MKELEVEAFELSLFGLINAMVGALHLLIT